MREQNGGKRDSNHVRNRLRHINAHDLIGNKLRHEINERNEQHELADDCHNNRAGGVSQRDKRHLAGNLDAEEHQHAAVNPKRLRREDDEVFIRCEDRGKDLREELDTAPENGRVNQRRGKKQPERLLHAGGIFCAVVVAQNRLRALC